MFETEVVWTFMKFNLRQKSLDDFNIIITTAQTQCR